MLKLIMMKPKQSAKTFDNFHFDKRKPSQCADMIVISHFQNIQIQVFMSVDQTNQHILKESYL